MAPRAVGGMLLRMMHREGWGRAEGSKVGQRKMWGRELQPMPPELWVSDGPPEVSQCRQRGLALTRHPPG